MVAPDPVADRGGRDLEESRDIGTRVELIREADVVGGRPVRRRRHQTTSDQPDCVSGASVQGGCDRCLSLPGSPPPWRVSSITGLVLSRGLVGPARQPRRGWRIRGVPICEGQRRTARVAEHRPAAERRRAPDTESCALARSLAERTPLTSEDDHPDDHPDDPTASVWIRRDRTTPREQARSDWIRTRSTLITSPTDLAVGGSNPSRRAASAQVSSLGCSGCLYGWQSR